MSVTVQVHVTWFPRSIAPSGQIDLGADDRATAMDLLGQLDVAPDSVLVVRDGVPIPLDARLFEGDSLRIVHTVSGG